MTPLYGRGPCGQRLLGHASYNHLKTTTFSAAMCHDKIVAPLVLARHINGSAFRASLEQCRALTLQPGQIVIADRVDSQKVAGVREAIEAKGAHLTLLPSYSHDCTALDSRAPYEAY